jgi:hypothetical protein
MLPWGQIREHQQFQLLELQLSKFGVTEIMNYLAGNVGYFPAFMGLECQTIVYLELYSVNLWSHLLAL